MKLKMKRLLGNTTGHIRGRNPPFGTVKTVAAGQVGRIRGVAALEGVFYIEIKGKTVGTFQIWP